MTESRPSILVIDDEPDMLATIRAVLEPAGFDVETAANLRDAIAKINIVAPAAIITDIFMPGGDGFELIAALRRYRLSVPVIAISGGDRSGQHDPLDIAEKLGAIAVMAKPFSKQELIDTVNRVVGGTAPREIEHGKSADGG